MITKEQALEIRGAIVELWLRGSITDEEFRVLMKHIGEEIPTVVIQ